MVCARDRNLWAGLKASQKHVSRLLVKENAGSGNEIGTNFVWEPAVLLDSNKKADSVQVGCENQRFTDFRSLCADSVYSVQKKIGNRLNVDKLEKERVTLLSLFGFLFFHFFSFPKWIGAIFSISYKNIPAIHKSGHCMIASRNRAKNRRW